MKGRSLLLSAILFLVAGLILILTYRTTKTDGVVIVGGIMFIVSGLLNIFAYMADGPGKRNRGSHKRRAQASQPFEPQFSRDMD